VIEGYDIHTIQLKGTYANVLYRPRNRMDFVEKWIRKGDDGNLIRLTAIALPRIRQVDLRYAQSVNMIDAIDRATSLFDIKNSGAYRILAYMYKDEDADNETEAILLCTSKHTGVKTKLPIEDVDRGKRLAKIADKIIQQEKLGELK
jgi:hypothetical protein